MHVAGCHFSTDGKEGGEGDSLAESRRARGRHPWGRPGTVRACWAGPEEGEMRPFPLSLSREIRAVKVHFCSETLKRSLTESPITLIVAERLL